jgi:leucyl-tRNA synthetase
MQFNLAISQMMIFINNIYKVKQISFEILEGFLILFSLFSPHLAEEINEVILKNKDSICLKKIPEFDKNIIISSEEVKIPIQINGKFKAILIVKNDSELAEIKKLAMENITIKTIIKGKKVKEVIIKDKKVINFVI